MKYSNKTKILYFSQNNRICGLDIRKCDKPIIKEKDLINFDFNFSEFQINEINDVDKILN